MSSENVSPTYDRQTKAAILTINNPDKYNMTHDEIVHIMHTKFKHIVFWCMCDEQGSCYHTHLYFLLSKKKRWSAIQKAFPHAHIEEAKGSPQQCRDYLLKEGDKFKDKAETKIEGTFYQEGELPQYFISADKNAMLLQIDEMIESGMRPETIMAQSIVFRQYETIIRKQFFAKRLAETPPLRDVRIIWHIGASGSGKSYTYTRLCEEYSEDEVFFASDYTNNCTALLDNYQGEKYLFLDEVKTDSFRYGYMLQLFQGYKSPLHSRYNNVYSLYIQIDATSIYTPDEIYEEMVNISNRSVDTKYQLLRRITDYCYHWKTEDGVYHTFQIPASEYTTYEELKNRAESSLDFQPIPDDTEIPFS